MTRKLHWPPVGRARCGRRDVLRADVPEDVTCLVCARPTRLCSSISPRGFLCAGYLHHDGPHWCRDQPRWTGTYPGARRRRIEPQRIPELSGSDLREWRHKLGLSMPEAERRVGISQKGKKWARWEHGNPPELLAYIKHFLPTLPG